MWYIQDNLANETFQLIIPVSQQEHFPTPIWELLSKIQ